MPDLTITTAECGGSRLSCHTLAVYLTWHRDGGISGDSTKAATSGSRPLSFGGWPSVLGFAGLLSD